MSENLQNGQMVQSTLTTKAVGKIKDLEAELEIPDPDPEVAKAILEEKEIIDEIKN